MATITGNTGPARSALSLARTGAAGLAVRSLARVSPWVESELLGLRHVVHPGDTCIDIGAAFGVYTAELSRLAGPDGAVHSVEPLRFAHSAPSRALGMRSAGNVVRHAVALGREPGRHTMSVPLRDDRLVTGRAFVTDGAEGLGSNDEFDGHVEVLVDTETLDGFRRRLGIGGVDFVKADVEGAELDVLCGAQDTLEECGPRLLLEIEDRHLRRFGRTAGAVVAWLGRRGYRMNAWHGRGWRPVPEVTPRWRNYLFCREPGRTNPVS